jgi:tetratricopeptide (TPR) repeat protein
MKKLFAAILLMATFTSSFAQVQAEPEMSDASRICLSTLVDPKVPTTAHKMLTNRLEQIIMKNGLAGSKNQRFVLGASVTELGKETTQTAPIMYIVHLSITFIIGDAMDGTKFAAASMEVKGLGASEGKAYTDALKKIKTTDPIFKGFIAKGKESIVKYFESNCEFIIKEAYTLADRKEYDKAIKVLERSDKDDARIMNALAYAYAAKGDIQKAKELWEKAAKLDNSDAVHNAQELNKHLETL